MSAGFIVSIAIFWIICGVFAYGLLFAHFQNKFPHIAEESRGSDQRFAMLGAICGPCGVGAFLMLKIMNGEAFFQYGWRLR